MIVVIFLLIAAIIGLGSWVIVLNDENNNLSAILKKKEAIIKEQEATISFWKKTTDLYHQMHDIAIKCYQLK